METVVDVVDFCVFLVVALVCELELDFEAAPDIFAETAPELPVILSGLSMPVSGSVVISITVSSVLFLHDTQISIKIIKKITDNIFLQFFIILNIIPDFNIFKIKNSFLILVICGFL